MQRRKKRDRIISFLLVCLMVLSTPLNVLAVETETSEYVTQSFTDEYMDSVNDDETAYLEEETFSEEDVIDESITDTEPDNGEVEEQIIGTQDLDEETTPAVELEDASDEAVTSIQVTVSISKDGAFVQTKDAVALDDLSLQLNGKSSYTIGDVLTAAHEQFYTGGADGFAASDAGWITKFWGEETMDVMYQVNDGKTVANSLAIEVKNGDFVHAYLLQNANPNTEAYAYFSEKTLSGTAGEPLTVTVKQIGYDEFYNPKEEACAGAAILVDGVDSGVVTGEDGTAQITIDQEGTHVLTAQKKNAEGKTAITAACCHVTVEAAVAKRTEEECLAALVAELGKYPVKTPLAFPYGTGEGQYTNALVFIQDQIKKIVPEYEVEFHYGNTVPGTSGSEKTMDQQNFDITPIHAAENTKPGFFGVTFSIGDKVSAKIAQLYLSVEPLSVTAQEAVDYEAGLVNFDIIKGTNTSQDYIYAPLGKTTGSTVGVLPTAPQIYTNKNPEREVAVTWTLTQISGTKGCMTLANNKITVVRPNVEQEDAHYQLTATYSNKKDSSIKKEVIYDLTVPAFEASTLPVRITPADAALTVTDGYYNKEVAEQYIQSSEEGALRTYTLHASGNGSGNQSYTWKAEKDGYITKTGTFSVGRGEQTEQTITLTPSSEDDAKLKSLEVSSPAPGAPSIKTPMAAFEKDAFSYEMTVGAIDSISIKGAAVVPEAEVQVKRYANLTNANKGTYAKPAILTATGSTTCYLKSEGDTVIEITVTAPAGSTQEVKTRTYTLTVKKNGEAAHSLKSLTLTASDSEKRGITKNTLKDTGYTEEEVLSPAVDAGGVAEVYRYEVNYYRDQITVKPVLTDTKDTVSITYKQDGIEQTITTTNNKASAAIPLAVGDNYVDVTVTKTGSTETENYHLQIHRKQQPEGTMEIEGTETAFSFTVEKDWSGSMNFSHSLREVPLKLTLPENVTVRLQGDDKEYKNEDTMTVSVGDSEKTMLTLFWVRTVTGEENTDVMEPQRYVVSLVRAASEGADFLGSYLPAPGQFVNVDIYKNPSITLAGPSTGRMVTLGSFGGSIVYKFDTPVMNSDQNPYGVDFIVFGNVQKSTSGESYASGMEPAAVMVSQDGSTWYELAGSDYYERSTQHNISLTYKNPDNTFQSAVDIPWTDSTGASGAVKANSYHSQSYYPDPLTYGELNKGIGENTTYTADSMTVTGTRVSNSAALCFGYGDTHANADGNLSTAANPYKENPYYNTNGDGMDISWAVDADGNPVHLDSIQYVKIYTAQSKDNGAMGEVSSEVSGVMRAKSAASAVGVTEDLESIVIDGTQINLTAGTYSYDVTVKDVSAFKVIPTARENSNIYVSNQWVKSGSSSTNISVQNTLRVIVQDDQKEPAIYYFHLTGTEAPEDSTTLKSVSVMPGAIEAEETAEGYTVTLLDSCQKVRLMAVPQNENASVKINGKAVSKTEGYIGEILPLSDTDTVIQVEVTSESGKVTKTYPVTVKKVPVDEQHAVQVTVSLVGDENHGSGKHNWSSLWLNKITCKVPENSTAKFVTEMLFLNNDISFTEKNDNYIETINGLSEFDNGPRSGWMYGINGTTDGVDAIDIQHITRDCEIIWFYVDDYVKDSSVPNLETLNANHECVWNEGEVVEQQSCTTAGSKKYTCVYCKKTKTETIPATGHKYGEWKVTSEATVFAPAVQTRTCSVCGNAETQKSGNAVKATIKVNATTVPLKVKQKTSAFKVTGLANGDSVQSYKSSNTKIFTVTKNGVLKAGKKTGKATLTITLASGLQKKVTVKVQKKAVATSKITGLQKKVTLKKGKKLALKPSRTPITSVQKFTYKSSNKKIATVNRKGVITAKKAGKAKITVKSGKKKFTVTVTVTK